MELIPLEFQSIEQWLGWTMGIVASLVVQGEGQAYFVLMFQLLSKREKVVYDLNPVNHIDPRALPVLLMTGWGWGKKRVEEPSYFPRAWPYRSLMHMAAPIANLFLVGILGTIQMFLPSSVVQVAVEFTILLTIANFVVPIPPMALGRALCCPFPALNGNQSTVETVGAVVLTIVVAVGYWTGEPFLQSIILPPSRFIAKWVLAG
jgi:hypothetical protein